MPYAIRLWREVDKSTHSFSRLLPEFSTDLYRSIIVARDEKVVVRRQRLRFLQISDARKICRSGCRMLAVRARAHAAKSKVK